MTNLKTVKQFVAEYRERYPDTSLKPAHLYKAIAKNQLHCVRVGRLQMITDRDFERWIGGPDER